MPKPEDRDLDAEIRGHLALSVKERIERGEDPEAARRAALLEFGYIPAVRDSMRRVWYARWFEAAAALGRDLRVGWRSLRRAKGLAATVVVTLALGIGANAAIFSVVRGVLLRPLVNRGADQLLYVRQSAPGLGDPNTRFSVPEIDDFKSRAKTIAAFGDFSTIDFPLVGLGEPRVVKAGVVSGTYFDVMGLRPVLGRLISPADDGPNASSVAVLTHRFWTTELKSDPSVINKTVRLGALNTTIVGVLEPSVPYPADTEIIANVVTSPHHLSATMVTERTHRMTELFGRLVPGVTVERARAELSDIHAAMLREHPEAYSTRAAVQLSVTPLRDQIAAPARTILLVLLASACIVFVIACSNVANLILARSVRREGELMIRAALGASRGALRRTLLAESLVLCGAGALLGVVLARPFVTVVAGYAARFSVRALEVTVDANLLWVGAALAVVAAVALAYIPRLPTSTSSSVTPWSRRPSERSAATGSVRITPGTSRRLRLFAMTQIAFSFVLLAAAATLLSTLVALQTTDTGYDTRHVLAVDLPSPDMSFQNTQEQGLYEEISRRVGELPNVDGVALGTVVPWRDARLLPSGLHFAFDGYKSAKGEENPTARLRSVAPRFFAVLGVPIISGRDFTDDDRSGSEPVAIVSQSIARMFPNTDPIGRSVWWTDPLFKLQPRRIVGVVEDVDDENVVPGEAPTIYMPVRQLKVAGRLFVHTSGDPYAAVPAVKHIVRELSADQVVERAATLADVRAEVLAPKRLNAFVLSGFAGVGLLIAVVGVAGVLAFSVSARTREFGVRLAVGSTPRQLLMRVLAEGTAIVAVGLAAGALGGYGFVLIASRYFGAIQPPGAVPVIVAAVTLIAAAIVASLMPAARAAHVDVLQALRSE
jgi:putative ABC transport system permease protein